MKMSEITIGPLDGRSLRSCKRIAAKIFGENSSENQAVGAFSSPAQSGYTARLNGRTVGYVFWNNQNPAGVELQTLIVEKKHRRNGIGRMLLDKVVRFSRRKIFVTVDDRALEAHLLLRDGGFRAVRIERGTLQDRYVFEHDPESALKPEPKGIAQIHSA